MIIRKASFSRCKRYRYQLLRKQPDGRGRCTFIGLNPSTADVTKDDPTIRRCMDFAFDWGYQEMLMVNLFAFRTPYPSELKQTDKPEGTHNMRVLKRVCRSSDCVIVAWGNHGNLHNQHLKVGKALSTIPLYCFGITQKLQPIHPLYQPKDASLKPFDLYS